MSGTTDTDSSSSITRMMDEVEITKSSSKSEDGVKPSSDVAAAAINGPTSDESTEEITTKPISVSEAIDKIPEFVPSANRSQTSLASSSASTLNSSGMSPNAVAFTPSSQLFGPSSSYNDPNHQTSTDASFYGGITYSVNATAASAAGSTSIAATPGTTTSVAAACDASTSSSNTVSSTSSASHPDLSSSTTSTVGGGGQSSVLSSIQDTSSHYKQWSSNNMSNTVSSNHHHLHHHQQQPAAAATIYHNPSDYYPMTALYSPGATYHPYNWPAADPVAAAAYNDQHYLPPTNPAAPEGTDPGDLHGSGGGGGVKSTAAGGYGSGQNFSQATGLINPATMSPYYNPYVTDRQYAATMTGYMPQQQTGPYGGRADLVAGDSLQQGSPDDYVSSGRGPLSSGAESNLSGSAGSGGTDHFNLSSSAGHGQIAVDMMSNGHPSSYGAPATLLPTPTGAIPFFPGAQQHMAAGGPGGPMYHHHPHHQMTSAVPASAVPYMSTKGYSMAPRPGPGPSSGTGGGLRGGKTVSMSQRRSDNAKANEMMTRGGGGGSGGTGRTGPPAPPPALQDHFTNSRGRSYGSTKAVSVVKPFMQHTGPADTAAAVSLAPDQVHPTVEKLYAQHNYNSKTYDVAKNGTGARFFVIKSFGEDDIHRSIKYSIWCSTDMGNKKLDQAFKDRQAKGGKVLLFFSVNGSGHFCGMAEMTSALDYSNNSVVWSLSDKWRGRFTLTWHFVKDVPNGALRHIRLENNENKPVTNSRDCQEILAEKGRQVLKIISEFKHASSLFDDFAYYERRQDELVEKLNCAETAAEK